MARRRILLPVLALGGLWWWAVLRLALAPEHAGVIEGAVAAGGWGLSLLPVHAAARPSARPGKGADVAVEAEEPVGGHWPVAGHSEGREGWDDGGGRGYPGRRHGPDGHWDGPDGPQGTGPSWQRGHQ
ncbi:hypothetical protein GCM10011583_40980 [Streptomyces camponoticapitis]|uniref:Secreted protein n=1 Tax=Streptomyces camponoticapitis TaxID=1616125 RepID=A0ABQ2ECJ1_9ACTN|nr:hypothetical protein [Streptomyces camponoticapitis]GGK05092.1 hypothetical protein GCM10011583_40980 [Streptomyces camponoticapitis]